MINYIVAGFIITSIIIVFILWLFVVICAVEDVNLYLYKEKEKREIDAEYIEKAESEKDKQLLKEYEDEISRINNNGSIL